MIGLIIKANRQCKKVSILELSAVLGFSTNHVSKIENGNVDSPSLRLYLKICKGLEIEFSDIIRKLINKIQ